MSILLSCVSLYGARNLGEPAGGRAEGWKQFTRILGGMALGNLWFWSRPEAAALSLGDRSSAGTHG